MASKKTRIISFFRKITSSFIYSFFIFVSVLLIVTLCNLLFGFDISGWSKIYSAIYECIERFVERLSKPDLSDQMNFLYISSNVLIIAVLVTATSYLRKYIRRTVIHLKNNILNKISLFAKKHIWNYLKTTLNVVLMCLYISFIIYYIYNNSLAVKWLYDTLSKIKYGLYIIFQYKSIDVWPLSHFGINLAIRYAAIAVFIILFINIPNMIYYLFIEKVPEYQPRQSHGEDDLDNGKYISRIVKAFWNTKKNKPRMKNIIKVLALISVITLMITDLIGNNHIVEIITFTEDVLDGVLLLSTIENSPFSSPPKLAEFANIVVRFAIGCFYIFEVGVAIYFIRHMWRWAWGKDTDSPFDNPKFNRVVATSILLPITIAILYILGLSKETNFSIWNPIMAMASFLVLSGIVFVIIYTLLKFYKYIHLAIAENAKDGMTGKTEANGKLKENSSNTALNKFKNYISYVWKNYIYPAITAQVKPLLKVIKKNNKIIGNKILTAAGNFAAVASLLTTFVGLLLFFWNDITTGNIILRAINITICFCFTAAIQYFLLEVGILIGERFSISIKYCAYKSTNKIDLRKTIGGKLIRFLATTVMLIFYIIPMSGSTLFSFSALFAANASVSDYHGIVDDDVWFHSMSIAKQVINNVVDVYVDNNTALMKETENQYLTYNKYYTQLNEWEDRNVYNPRDEDNPSYGDIFSNTVDSLVKLFNEQTEGTFEYKNLMLRTLLDDEKDKYEITSVNTKLYDMYGTLYGDLRSTDVEDYGIKINYNDYNDDSTSTPTPYPTLKPRSVSSKSKVQSLNKYQFIDVMFREFLNNLIITKNTVYTAKNMGYPAPSATPLVPSEKLYNGESDSEWNLNAYIDTYSTVVNQNKMIYNSYKVIKLVMTNELKAESASEFDQISTKPDVSPSVSPAPEMTISPNPSISPTPEVTEIPTASPIPESDKTNSTIDILEDFTSVENIPAFTEVYATYGNSSIDTRIKRLLQVLMYLPEVDDIQSGTISNSGKSILATQALQSPVLKLHKTDGGSDRQDNVSDTISKIGEYYNYAKSRNGSLSFAFDVLFKGRGGLNDVSGDINDIYKHTTFTRVLLLFAGLIDLIAVFTGFAGHFFFKNKDLQDNENKKDSEQ